VTLATESGGVTVYADGLSEYEATAGGEVAVTLLRAVGELSRGDLPERPGHAGWPARVPLAQAQGPFRAELAVFPHGPRDDGVIHRIESTADDVLLPLGGDTLRDAVAVPPAVRGVELHGEGLAFSACKPSEDGGATVLRCINLTGRAVHGAWRLGLPVREALRARLDETPVAGPPLRVRHDVVEFEAPPRGVVTILVR
jgi:alpha-mannosidase